MYEFTIHFMRIHSGNIANQFVFRYQIPYISKTYGNKDSDSKFEQITRETRGRMFHVLLKNVYCLQNKGFPSAVFSMNFKLNVKEMQKK